MFHDDQHGTAVITLAALINSLKIVDKKIDNIKVVISGAGSAGYGIFKILKEAGCRNIVVTDSKGAIYDGRKDLVNVNSQNLDKQEIAKNSNPSKLEGNLEEVIRKADVFIGVSGKPGLLTKDMIQSMNHDAIVFPLSNPDPEILPSDALEAGARIIGTGRSDYPNQVNNAVVFPSVLRALLDTRARGLDEKMLVTASYAIASLVEITHLKEDYIIPKVNDPRILPIVTQTLKEAIGKNDGTETKQG
ncbi:NAD(P)-dependent malic enzyme [Nitrososphaera sp. AFS]|uniref:NAD(P)-dependent malic enzyme n=1 Tax=Nitrososphaera sp. AFS TaxID=2301191 RepID=UPI00191722D7